MLRRGKQFLFQLSQPSSCRPYAFLQPVVLGCHPPTLDAHLEWDHVISKRAASAQRVLLVLGAAITCWGNWTALPRRCLWSLDGAEVWSRDKKDTSPPGSGPMQFCFQQIQRPCHHCSLLRGHNVSWSSQYPDGNRGTAAVETGLL
jgi:hypothetical protein